MIAATPVATCTIDSPKAGISEMDTPGVAMLPKVEVRSDRIVVVVVGFVVVVGAAVVVVAFDDVVVVVSSRAPATDCSETPAPIARTDPRHAKTRNPARVRRNNFMMHSLRLRERDLDE
jgi:hypothetical protein